MIKAKVNPVSIVDGVSLSTGRFHRVFGEMLTIARQAIVELGGSSLCVATIQHRESQIHITCPQPLSSEDLHNIIEKIAENIHQITEVVGGFKELSFTVNGVPREGYNFDGIDCKFDQQLVIPIAVQDCIIGLLYIASFDQSINLTKSRIVKHFSRHFARTLRHLWYLNIRQKATFELLVSRMFDGVIHCDPKGKILYLNNAAKRMLGVSSETNHVGKSLKSLGVNYLSEYFQEATESGIFELNKVTNLDGKKPNLVGVHLELLKNFRNSELGWMIILRDVTKNWQNDQMRSTIALASHELKTPLSSILGAVDLLLEKDLGDLNEKQQQCLNVVRDDVSRLDRLLTDILDLSRFDEGIQFLDRRKEIGLGFLVNKVLKSLSSFATSKNIQLENNIPKSLPTFKGNRDRLQQVLVNLIENGVKYSLPGATVTIDAELKDNDLKFWVEDTGVGIPEEELDKVFDRFVQLDNYPAEGRQGYGLGLSIAKEIIEAIDGKIWVESELGIGSKFCVSLPV